MNTFHTDPRWLDARRRYQGDHPHLTPSELLAARVLAAVEMRSIEEELRWLEQQTRGANGEVA